MKQGRMSEWNAHHVHLIRTDRARLAGAAHQHERDLQHWCKSEGAVEQWQSLRHGHSRIFGCSTQQQAVDRLHGVLARVEEEMAVGVV